MKDSSETAKEQLGLEMSKLQKQNQQLQQENKVLQLRATGVQVLGKVLQDSQEESEQLKQQVIQLQEKLKQNGIEEPRLSSVFSDTTLSHKSGIANPSLISSSSCAYSSTSLQSVDPYSSSLPDRKLQFSSLTGPPSLYHVSHLHTKELHQKFKELKEKLEKLNQLTHELMEKMKTLDSEECKAEIKVKLGRLKNRIQNGEKEAKTREALIGCLMSQEEDLKAKWAVVEAEQVSQENVAQQLFKDIEEDKEELEHLQDEITFYEDTVVVNKQRITAEMESKSSVSSELAGKSQRTCASTTLSEGPVDMVGGSVDEDFQQRFQQLQLQCTELQRIIEELRGERDDAAKQKEEILDVNHLWDTQYRQLQAETTQEISELKQKIELLTCDDSQKRFDKLWIKTKDMVDVERRAKEQAKEEKQICQERCKNLEEELIQVKEQNKTLQLYLEQKGKHVSLLQENLSRLSPMSSMQYGNVNQQRQDLPAKSAPCSSQQRAPTGGAFNPVAAEPPSLHAPPEIVDQIEMLKTQLRLYVDDFQSERSDRERAQAEKQKLNEELNAVKDQILVLEAQVEQFENDWKKEKEEKERLQRQLQTGGCGGQVPVGFEYQSQAQLTQKAQAIAEQQARLKVMRENQDIHERLLEQERQKLEQQARAMAHEQPQHYWHTGYGSQYNPGQASTVEPHLAGTAGVGTRYSPYVATGRLDYTSDQLQLLQRQQQQYLHARGPIQSPSDQRRPLDDMFKGGEVQPDSDMGYEVIDSGSDGKEKEAKPRDQQTASNNQCPRCLRTFKEGENELLLGHIEKCIS